MTAENINIGETHIRLRTDIEDHGVAGFILGERMKLIGHIQRNHEFLTSLEPIHVSEGPLIVRMMSRASGKADVGPMAAVAGTIAQLSLMHLMGLGSRCSIVDNGGDIALVNNRKVTVGLYAGSSSLSGTVGFLLKPGSPRGICTSSGTVGHSISFGRADSVTVFASEASTADALATSIANSADGPDDRSAVESALERADDFREHFRGVMIVVGEHAGTVGKIPKLVMTDRKAVLSDLWEEV
ncbi:UPF0280 family protein [Methanothermobacter sp. KEPCO-1]|uniref:UPF0280 protein MTBMA_c11230 n=1 Tax=Methanothermobacter marburgensis (strain ATCC BAA-927 / DSM 2133 / JCM 14651 / NBRC 100331 / OCM 82 / Marburg) TaxID=79929 RepID=D9PWW9_METTM|nr:MULTISPECIES: UPF0280 family protein [Methanothermobacter]ADL58717.1 conserved hypothetical protein [Methanothermobacter marburgensis str. Marburg]QEF95076.1 UPF0280 family protein [Methanothermobacter sp. KEPCO-1]WBF09285.1 UPF0280 family protein [Methanothermobacter marburgensis]